MTARTQEEILARFHAVADTDWLGFRQDVLLESMTSDSLRAIADASLDGGESFVEPTLCPIVAPDLLEQAARDYLTFAVEKAIGHRGLSASRSVDKLREYAWLLGRDDVVAAMEVAEYPQYGAPKLRAFAEGMGWAWPGDVDAQDATALERMTQGLPCQDDCRNGCDL